MLIDEDWSQDEVVNDLEVVDAAFVRLAIVILFKIGMIHRVVFGQLGLVIFLLAAIVARHHPHDRCAVLSLRFEELWLLERRGYLSAHRIGPWSLLLYLRLG